MKVHPAFEFIGEGYDVEQTIRDMGFEVELVHPEIETAEDRFYEFDPLHWLSDRWNPTVPNAQLVDKYINTAGEPTAVFVRPQTDWAREILALGDAHQQYDCPDLFSRMVAGGAVKRFVNSRLTHQDSGNTEWYTPAYIVEAARRVMDGIDLDPASSAKANEVVQATVFYTAADDGLSKPWGGRIWMNHPYSREGNPRWIARLVEEYREGNVTEACCICYAAVSAKWFRPLFDFPRWIPPKRINYIDPATGQPVKGVQKDSTVTYLGPNLDRFIEEFQNKLGGRTDMPADTTAWQQVVVGYENGHALTESVQDWAR